MNRVEDQKKLPPMALAHIIMLPLAKAQARTVTYCTGASNYFSKSIECPESRE
jgi:hypothetical protein